MCSDDKEMVCVTSLITYRCLYGVLWNDPPPKYWRMICRQGDALYGTVQPPFTPTPPPPEGGVVFPLFMFFPSLTRD